MATSSQPDVVSVRDAEPDALQSDEPGGRRQIQER